MKKTILYKSHSLIQDDIWNEGASEFAFFSRKISFYHKIANIFTAYLDIYKHINICDLGCGSSGLLINNILNANINLESIYCIDYSYEMLKVCADNVINSSKIKFIKAHAEDFSKFLPTKLDLVIADSSFWLFNTQESIKDINLSLVNEGDFIFNFAEWDFNFENHPPHPKYKEVDFELQRRNIEIVKEGGGKKKFSKKVIEELLTSNGFSLISYNDIFIETTKQDWLNFYSIPSIVRRSMPVLSLDLGMDVLKSAIDNLSIEQLKPIRWIFFLARKQTTCIK